MKKSTQSKEREKERGALCCGRRKTKIWVERQAGSSVRPDIGTVWWFELNANVRSLNCSQFQCLYASVCKVCHVSHFSLTVLHAKMRRLALVTECYRDWWMCHVFCIYVVVKTKDRTNKNLIVLDNKIWPDVWWIKFLRGTSVSASNFMAARENLDYHCNRCGDFLSKPDM